MSDYYSDTLSAERLKRAYEIAPGRIQQYLEAEINYVLHKIRTADIVLELGCGYGRIIPHIAKKAAWVIGIDTSYASLRLGQEILSGVSNCLLLQMNALHLAFRDSVFDSAICIQNGISAFHVNQRDLIRESIRVTKSGGTVLFSTYSDKFWEDRLEWFHMQSKNGLLGEIDPEKTRNGVIVCKDGFTATTVRPGQFQLLTQQFDVDTRITEVDESSLFCEILVH